VVDKVPEMMQS